MEGASTTSGDRAGDAADHADHDPADHDAPWRPGFDGWDADVLGIEGDTSESGNGRSSRGGIEWSREHDQSEPEPWVPVRRVRPPPPVAPSGPPVAQVEGSPPSAVTGQVVLVGVGVLGALLLTAVVALAIRPDGSPSAAPRVAPLIPEQVDPLWAADVDGLVGAVAIGDDVLVASTNVGSGLRAFDLLTGVERWSRTWTDVDRDIAGLALIDDSVVVQQRGPVGAPTVKVIDATTGEDRWSSSADSSYSIVEAPGGHAILRRFRDGGSTRAELIDPMTGSAVGDAITVSDVSVPGPFLGAEFERRAVVVWSVESGLLDVPAVDSFGLRTIAPLGDSVVGLDLEARIVAFDADGRRADERPFVSDAFGDFAGRADLVGVVEGADVGIIGSGSSVGFTVTDGSIETVWRRSGRASRPVVTADGPIGLLVGPDESSGEINATIIDPATGETIATTDVGMTREIGPLLGHNAYVVAPELGAADRMFAAHRYDGVELWSLSVPEGVEVQVSHGVVALVDRWADGDNIVVAG